MFERQKGVRRADIPTPNLNRFKYHVLRLSRGFTRVAFVSRCHYGGAALCNYMVA